MAQTYYIAKIIKVAHYKYVQNENIKNQKIRIKYCRKLSAKNKNPSELKYIRSQNMFRLRI